MSKYRAVLMVPSIVEFENPGTSEQAANQARAIANGMGKAASAVRLHTYIPIVMEVVPDDGYAEPLPPSNLDIRNEVDPFDGRDPESA